MGCGGCESGSEGWSGFNLAFHLENGCSDCKNGVFVFRFLYFSGLVRRNSFVNVVFAVGECGVAG